MEIMTITRNMARCEVEVLPFACEAGEGVDGAVIALLHRACCSSVSAGGAVESTLHQHLVLDLDVSLRPGDGHLEKISSAPVINVLNILHI